MTTSTVTQVLETVTVPVTTQVVTQKVVPVTTAVVTQVPVVMLQRFYAVLCSSRMAQVFSP